MAPFRFTLQVSHAATPDAWKALARQTEDLGYSTLYIPDHLDDQWAPLIALTVAAEATTTLRVGTLVLDNDFRHPVILAKEAATMDVVTGGRFELGMGAGWMTTDYNQSGIPMDAAAVRIARLAESLEIMRAMWSTGRATLAGEHYTVTEAIGTPNPVTPGGPPLVIGGGSKRILTLAGRYAQTVSVVPSLAAGVIGADVAAESVVEKYADRVKWAKEAAGDRADELEFQCWTAVVQVVPNAAELFENLAPAFGLTTDQLRQAPIALVGTVEEIAETLQKRREELGFSNIVVHEAEMHALAPVIAELAGTERAERIGILGGTFDPPHAGHAAAATAVLATLALDRLLLVVANDPWQKSPTRAVTPAEDRFAMTQALAQEILGAGAGAGAGAGTGRGARATVEASRLEIDRGGPSYTVITAEELIESARVAGRPDPELFLIVGADLVPELGTWERTDDLRNLVTLAVVSRPPDSRPVPPAGWRVEWVDGPQIDVSSSAVRGALSQGGSVEKMVPPAVVHCIRSRNLYAVGR